MQALARANRVRLARAELKRSVGRGEVDVAEVIRECPWETESMTLAELLTSQRRWGRTRARKLLQTLALSENKRIGTLTPRQRALLTSGPRFSVQGFGAGVGRPRLGGIRAGAPLNFFRWGVVGLSPGAGTEKVQDVPPLPGCPLLQRLSSTRLSPQAAGLEGEAAGGFLEGAA